MRIELYQIKDIAKCDYAFHSYDNRKFNFDDYECVYVESNSQPVTDSTLGEIYRAFNIIHPCSMHSMSVSDIVRLDDKYYYCEDFGWKEIQPTRKMVVYKYDLFPYFKIGELVSVTDDGYAKIKGYDGYVFKYTDILAYDQQIIDSVNGIVERYTKDQKYREELTIKTLRDIVGL